MNKKELFEWIRMHHPDVNETMLTKLVNRAMDDFCEKTEIIKTASTLTTTSNQRFYNLANDILKIKELRIDELPIPRLQDTGIIDSTPIYTPFDSSDNENEEDVIPNDGLIQAAHFNNVNKDIDGSVPYGAARYITIPKEFFTEVDNTAAMTISFWVKFDSSEYNNVGYLFNNSGRDMSNGRCDIRFFSGHGTFSGSATTGQGAYRHTPSQSFAATFAPKNINSAYDYYNGATSGVNNFRVGVADSRNWSFKTGQGALETKNKWRLMTLTYDGRSATEGDGLRLFNNLQVGNMQSSFQKFSTQADSPYNLNNNENILTTNWHDGTSADGYGQVKPHITSGNYYTHGSSGGVHTHESTQDIQLGCFKYAPGSVAIQSQPASSLANLMSDITSSDIYSAGNTVFPFSGWMRNLFISSSTFDVDKINNIYSLGPNATYDDVSGVDSNLTHFYLLKENANDSVGSINGTNVGGLEYTNTADTKAGGVE